MERFNDIKDFKEPCPKCGKELHFQTKDDMYDDVYLRIFCNRSIREFHTICPNCRIQIRYTLREEWHINKINEIVEFRIPNTTDVRWGR